MKHLKYVLFIALTFFSSHAFCESHSVEICEYVGGDVICYNIMDDAICYNIMDDAICYDIEGLNEPQQLAKLQRVAKQFNEEVKKWKEESDRLNTIVCIGIPAFLIIGASYQFYVYRQQAQAVAQQQSLANPG